MLIKISQTGKNHQISEFARSGNNFYRVNTAPPHGMISILNRDYYTGYGNSHYKFIVIYKI